MFYADSSFDSIYILFYFLYCFNDSFISAVSQYTELEGFEAVLATQDLLVFEGTDISE